MRPLPLFLAAGLLLGTGCPSEPVDSKDDSGEPRVDADRDGWFEDEDCDDGDAEVFPGATEVCNGQDDDCDGQIDEGLLDPWYADVDGDGYGDPHDVVLACNSPEGRVPFGTDCDDSDDGVNPAAAEVCNGEDDDCDGETDEGLLSTWYADADGDGWGDPAVFTQDCSDVQPSGTVAVDGDCDDGDAAINPDADELCDGEDDDCDGQIDEGDALDAVRWFADADGDGHGDVAEWVMACEQPSGHVGAAEADDCDDGDASVHPGADEYCDGVDDDCDGLVDEEPAVDAPTWYQDADGDGFGNPRVETPGCDAPAGFVANADDCNDLYASAYPGATETCNGRDDDCDGTADEASAVDAPTWYLDGDGDGFGDPAVPAVACTAPAHHVADDTDCDDGDAAVNPDAVEVCDGADEDCDGVADDGALGTGTLCPAEDCSDVLADDPGAPDGSYYMSDGYWWDCDMSTDGGGWLEVSTAVQVWGTGYDTQYHNIAGFRWNEVLFRYSAGSSTAGCTYPTAIPSSNPLAFQFGTEDWGLPANTCGTTCGSPTTDYAADTRYLSTAWDFVVGRAESSDTIRVAMLEGALYCTTSDNWGYAWVDILIRR